jgi:REP element-mobilizing transposase RayT
MTRSRYRIYETEYPYFMTCTIVGWLPVFTRPEAVDIIFDSWRFLQEKRHFQLYGYVILENHLHLIASAPELSEAVKSFKMFTANQLLALLDRHSAHTLLRQLSQLKLAHKTASKHQVWQEGSHAEQLSNNDMMLQKLEYMQNNPIKRGYVDDPVHWRYSSARNYAGQPGLMQVVTDWPNESETEFRRRAFPNRVWERGECYHQARRPRRVVDLSRS